MKYKGRFRRDLSKSIHRWHKHRDHVEEPNKHGVRNFVLLRQKTAEVIPAQCSQTCRCREFEIVAVERIELFEIENRRIVGDSLEREGLDKLVGREDLSFAMLRAPAEKRKVIDQSFGKISHLAEPGHGCCAMPFREALRVRAENRCEMDELGILPTKSFVDSDLLRSIGNVVVSTNHVRDTHKGIVDRHDIVVNRNAGAGTRCSSVSRADQDGIAYGFGSELQLAADHVVKANGAVGNLKAN